ncbi:MAG: class I SAM-dependent methyltransferase [bacterium]
MDKESQYLGKDLEAMASAKNYYQWELSEVRAYLGQRVAEVGAGCGHFSKNLLETPICCLHAFEPSKNMYDLLEQALRKDARAKAIHGNFNNPDGAVRYDSILYINVLEHIEQDEQELTHARESLAANGFLVIFVPALAFLYSDFDKQIGHYRRYNKKGLSALVKKAGFSIVKVKYFDMLGMILWYLHFVVMKRTMTGASVSIYDRFCVPVLRFFERLIPPLIGKNILLIAQKDPRVQQS